MTWLEDNVQYHLEYTSMFASLTQTNTVFWVLLKMDALDDTNKLKMNVILK